MISTLTFGEALARATSRGINADVAYDLLWKAVYDGEIPTIPKRGERTGTAYVGTYGKGKEVSYVEEVEIKTYDVRAIDEWLSKLTGEAALQGTDTSQSAHMRLIERGRVHFTGKSPKKAEIIEYFLKQKLPNGQPISKNQAENMATFCRDPEMMRGGNKRIS